MQKTSPRKASVYDKRPVSAFSLLDRLLFQGDSTAINAACWALICVILTYVFARMVL